jgi:nicotinate-nucleotide adenylyltransferase
MNIALFGGSFDPPHLGHVAIIAAALKHLDIERLYVIPAYLNPFKSEFAAPPQLRLKWLTKIIDDPRVIISDFEIAQERSVRSIETVEHFKPGVDTLYMIIGADNVPHLHEWHRFEALNAAVTWVVATRQGVTLDTGFIHLDIDIPISSSSLRHTCDARWLPPEIAQDIINFYKEHHCKNA